MKIKLFSKPYLPQIVLATGIILFIVFLILNYYGIINAELACVLFLVASAISIIGAGLMGNESR